MNRSRPAARLSFALACCLLAAGLLGSAQVQVQKPPFQPSVGQDGKDVVWVPTSEALVQKMLDMAKVSAADTVMDLGSGDGRTVIAAAKRGARALGVEYNPDMVELSRANAVTAGLGDKVTFVQGDLFETDFSKATVITMFLLPDINIRLRPRLLELEPGTRVVSNSFRMEEWVPDAEETVTEGCESWCTALLWIIPARVEGTWKLAQGTLTLEQAFQMVSGAMDTGRGSVPITEGRLRGDEIVFTVNGTRYTGRVNGETMAGLTSDGKTNGTWSARRM